MMPKKGDVVVCSDPSRHLRDPYGYRVESFGVPNSAIDPGTFAARGQCLGGLYAFAEHEWKPMLVGWRICAGIRQTDGWQVRSLFPTHPPTPVFIQALQPLCQYGVHVGTSKQFCLDFYRGLVELQADEKELLLMLNCTDRLVREFDAERWTWKCATEAKVNNPIVLTITELT